MPMALGVHFTKKTTFIWKPIWPPPRCLGLDVKMSNIQNSPINPKVRMANETLVSMIMGTGAP